MGHGDDKPLATFAGPENTPHEIVLSVSLDERAMPLGEVLDLRVGSTLVLSRRVDDALELCLDGVPAGRGYAIEREGALGVWVTERTGAASSARSGAEAVSPCAAPSVAGASVALQEPPDGSMDDAGEPGADGRDLDLEGDFAVF